MMELKTFAIAVYSETGVADACLTLQDQHHVDVPLLLFCGWFGSRHGCLQQNQLELATEISKQLGAHVIKPLRQARRWMKNRSLSTGNAGAELADSAERRESWEKLREQVKGAELKAELLLLDTLEGMFISQLPATDNKPPHATIADIRHNLRMMLPAGTETDGIDDLLELIATASLKTIQLKSGPP